MVERLPQPHYERYVTDVRVCLHEYRNLLRRLLTLWRSETRQLRIKRIEQSTNVSIVIV